MLLRFRGGARGMLWSSQVTPGNENGLRLRVYGSLGGLEWAQEQPNVLLHTHVRRAAAPDPPCGRRVLASGRACQPDSVRPSGGLPRGVRAALSRLRRADHGPGRGQGTDPACLLVPGIEAGLRGMQFIDAAVRSSAADAAWTVV